MYLPYTLQSSQQYDCPVYNSALVSGGKSGSLFSYASFKRLNRKAHSASCFAMNSFSLLSVSSSSDGNRNNTLQSSFQVSV